jgi:type II secretory pathway pseudopilin PulG
VAAGRPGAQGVQQNGYMSVDQSAHPVFPTSASGGGLRRPCRQRGASLVELIIAVAVCSFGFAALSAVSLHCRRLVAVQRETVAANQLVQERLETIRSTGWNQLTSASALRDTVLGTASTHTGNLHGAREQITVTPYPAVTPAPAPLQIERTADGQTRIISEPASSFSLRRMTGLRVDVRVEWSSRQNRRTRIREISTVVALGGLLK